MDGSSAAMRIAAALLVAGALSVGAAACGSSSGSTQSASVPTKEAGFQRGTRLEIVNKLGSDDRLKAGPLQVTVCAVNVGCDGRVVAKDASTAIANSSESTPEDVNGTIIYPDGSRLDFSAGNPNYGKPWIKLSGDAVPGGPDTVDLPDPSAQRDGVLSLNCGFLVLCSRAADTSDYVMLGLQIGQ